MRRFLAASVAAVAVAAAFCTGANGAVTAAQNDINTLNYALTLERLEYEFYRQGQAKFTSQNFTDAGVLSGAYEYFTLIREHELAHVNFLQSALGSNAIAACGTYTFSAALTNVTTYIQNALALEEVGVGAYDGAINALTDASTQQNAATIATIEARHAAYLRQVNGLLAQKSAAEATDVALNVTQVLSAAGGFVNLTGCSITAPIIRPGGVATANTLANAQRTSPDPLPNITYTQAQFNNDLSALNYALTLERLESAFYEQGQAKFNEAAFQAKFNATLGTQVRQNFELIRAHEAAHVSALASTIATRGGTAVQACTYNFTAALADINSYVATARILETVGVGAYDWAIAAITDTGLSTIAATIATVEGRHASYLNVVNGRGSTDGLTDNNLSFDKTLDPQTVLGLAAQFYANSSFPQACPSGSNPAAAGFAPTVAPGQSIASSSSSSSSTGTQGGGGANAAASANAVLSTVFGLVAAAFFAAKRML